MNQTIGTNEERRSAYEVAIDLGGALALQKAILNLIERNGLPVSTAQRDRLRECEDLTVLNEVLLRAITADSVDALFAEL